MLTADGCRARRRALREHFQEHDLLLVSQPQHIFYLSGFLTRPTELAGQGLNFLLIDGDGECRLLADNLSQAATQHAHVDHAHIWTWYDSLRPAEARLAAAAEALSRLLYNHYAKLERVAVERAHLPVAAREMLAVAQADDLGPALRRQRRRKYEDEVACIRRAIAAAEAGHRAARDNIRPGITEMDIYAEVQAAITRAAGEPIVMLGDFAAGERSGQGGGPPTGNVLQPGDLMIFDLFPRIGGYRADITNTLWVGESPDGPTQEQQDHVAVLQAAMQAGEAMLRPGVTAAEVYAAVREPIVAAGLGDAFSHHAGHGLGLGHPEAPFLVPESQEILQAGDVVTLEPGAYRHGWGGARIEHDYLITETGYRRLSNHQIGL